MEYRQEMTYRLHPKIQKYFHRQKKTKIPRLNIRIICIIGIKNNVALTFEFFIDQRF